MRILILKSISFDCFNEKRAALKKLITFHWLTKMAMSKRVLGKIKN